MEVSQSSPTPFEQTHHLSVVGNVADEFPGLRIIHHRSAGHVDILVLPLGAVALVFSSVSSVLGEDVPLVFQVEQRPVVVVASKEDTPAVAAVAAVGSAIGVVFHMPEVHGATAALARAAADFHIVNKIRFHDER